MFKSMFSIHPSQSFQALLLQFRAPSAAIKTSYSCYGIFRPLWSKVGESALKPGARRAGDADGYGPKLRKPGENRRFTVNAPAAFIPSRLPSGFDDEGLTVQDHVALDGLKQDLDQACANFSRIEQQAAAVQAYTEGRHTTPPNLQVSAQEALAQIDLMTERLTRRANDIEVASLGRVLPPAIAQNGKGMPAQPGRLTGNPVTPALPPSRRESWKLVTLASLRPERALPANRASRRSGPENVLRLQLNQLARKKPEQPAGVRTAALRANLGRMADTLQGHHDKVGEELQMKVERRKNRSPKGELPPPVLTPKSKKKDGS